MSELSNSAQACLSLSYKYANLIDCVKNQRPELLSDERLKSLSDEMERAVQTFESRVKELADQKCEP